MFGGSDETKSEDSASEQKTENADNTESSGGTLFMLFLMKPINWFVCI